MALPTPALFFRVPSVPADTWKKLRVRDLGLRESKEVHSFVWGGEVVRGGGDKKKRESKKKKPKKGGTGKKRQKS